MTPRVSPDGKWLAYVRRVRTRASCTSATRVGPRPCALRSPGQGPAGGLGDSRPLPAVRVDARREVDRDLGRGQDLAGGCRERAGHADSLQRARRADASTTRVRLRAAGLSRREFPGQGADATSQSRPTADAWPTARSATSTSRICRAATPKRLTHRRRRRSSSRRSGRPTASGSCLHDLDRRRLRPHPGGPSRRHAAARDVVTKPGHYTEPAFSPDGTCDRVPRRRERRDPRSALQRQRGIYVVPTDGSAPRTLVRESGLEPSFDATGTRIYVQRHPRRQDRARERRDRRSGLTAVRAATKSCTSSPTTPRRSCRRRTASGSRSPNAGTPSSRRSPIPGGRSTSVRRSRAIRPRGFPATRASTSTGPATAAKVHWSLGPELFTRDLCADVHVPRPAALREARRARGEGRHHRLQP